MNDWQVGDLAVCVDREASEGLWFDHSEDELPPSAGPRTGEVNRVTWHGIDAAMPILRFERYPAQDDVFAALCFRKILPDKHEDCEPEFVTLLKRIKRKQTVSASGTLLRENTEECSRAKPSGPAPLGETPR